MRLGINISLTGQSSGFGPASLFSAGQPGVWYDPSDITTLFQTNATPVTAAGQAVGVMLDKSKGLTPGPQLVTNGDFSAGLTGWAGQNAALSVANGRLVVANDSTSNATAYQSITTVVGKTYLLTGVVSDPVDCLPRLAAGTVLAAGDLVTFQYTGTGDKVARCVFVATGTTTWINALTNSLTATASARFDDISVQEIPGNHAFQSTAGFRPLYQIDGTGKPYLSFDGIDDELTATTLNFSGVPYVAAVVGQRKERDTTIGTLLSHGGSTSTAGFWQIFAPRSDTNYGWRGFSSTPAAMDVTFGTLPQPDLAVITGLFDPSAAVGVQITGRRNGVQVVQGVSALQLAPFVSTSFTVGKRGSNDLPYLGRVYGVIVVGAATSAATVSSMESWMNSKTGAY